MDQFQEKISSKEFSIVEICRIKNGFVQYKHEAATYTDIKFNVVIKGHKISIIGEVQFLLKRMFEFKKIAHRLYSIQRNQEYVDDLSELLPTKLDLTKQLFIFAARNNIDGITDLMVTHGFDQNDILQINQQKQSILTPICAVNCEKVFRFLMHSMPKEIIKERLLLPEASKSYPLKRAIQYNHYNGVLKLIFTDDKFGLLQQKDYAGKTPLEICWSFNRGKCALLVLQNVSRWEDRLKMIEYSGGDTSSLQFALKSGDYECCEFIFSQLDYNKRLKSTLLTYKTWRAESNYHYAARSGNLEVLQLLLSKCDDEQKDLIFSKNDRDEMPAYLAVTDGKKDVLKFMLEQMDSKQIEDFCNTRSKGNEYDPIVNLPKRAMTGWYEEELSQDHIATFKVLINHIVSGDPRLFSAWLFAAHCNDIEMGKIILNKASDEKMKNKIINYQATHHTDDFATALHASCKKGSVQFLEWILTMIPHDSQMLKSKNYKGGDTPIMLCARKCSMKCARLLLQKMKGDKKMLQEVLKINDKDGTDVINVALQSPSLKARKMAKLLISYFDEDDDGIFLPSLQFGDVESAKRIWNKTNGDKKLQKKLLTMQNKDNCMYII